VGDLITLKGVNWLVVRIVKSRSLIEEVLEDKVGKIYVLDEHYLELRNEEGLVDFLILGALNTDFEGTRSHIKAIPPVIYGGKQLG
jgi:hypothetical protein